VEGEFILNVPAYMYISTNVASAFNEVFESHVVQSYLSHLPGNLAHKWGGSSSWEIARDETINKELAHGKSFVASIISLSRLVRWLSSAPLYLQQVAVRFILDRLTGKPFPVIEVEEKKNLL
jgi:hypothetical protein